MLPHEILAVIKNNTMSPRELFQTLEKERTMTLREIGIQVAKDRSLGSFTHDRFGEVEWIPTIFLTERETFTYEGGVLVAYDYRLPDEEE